MWITHCVVLPFATLTFQRYSSWGENFNTRYMMPYAYFHGVYCIEVELNTWIFFFFFFYTQFFPHTPTCIIIFTYSLKLLTFGVYIILWNWLYVIFITRQVAKKLKFSPYCYLNINAKKYFQIFSKKCFQSEPRWIGVRNQHFPSICLPWVSPKITGPGII